MPLCNVSKGNMPGTRFLRRYANGKLVRERRVQGSMPKGTMPKYVAMKSTKPVDTVADDGMHEGRLREDDASKYGLHAGSLHQDVASKGSIPEDAMPKCTMLKGGMPTDTGPATAVRGQPKEDRIQGHPAQGHRAQVHRAEWPCAQGR